MNKCWNIVGLVTAALILAALLLPALSIALSAIRKRVRNCNAVVAALFVLGVVLYGGSKGWISGRITYPRSNPDTQYIVDRGSFVTNDYIHVDFVKSILVPGSADIQGWYRELASTNDDDWVQFIDTTFNDFPVPVDLPFPAATNYNFVFFTEWAPTPSAHTNGTATIMWTKRDENTLIPYRTGIYLDDERISPNHSITNGPFEGSVNLLQNLMEEI